MKIQFELTRSEFKKVVAKTDLLHFVVFPFSGKVTKENIEEDFKEIPYEGIIVNL